MAFLDFVLFDAAAQCLKPTPAQIAAPSASISSEKSGQVLVRTFCDDPVHDYNAADEIINLCAVLFTCFHSYPSQQPIVSFDDLKILDRPP